MKRILLAAVLAHVLTLLSVLVERRGPEQVVFSNLCGPNADQLCYRPALKGGFPFGYLWDAPGISVENQLAFFEDYFHHWPFVANLAFWFVIALAAALAIQAVRTQAGGIGRQKA